MTSYPAWVDEEYPPAGPCAFCGGPDKRHRVIDAMVGAIGAGDDPGTIAKDYGFTEGFVRRLYEMERPQEGGE